MLTPMPPLPDLTYVYDGTVIASTANLNNYTTKGLYRWSSGPTNSPTAAAAAMFVLGWGGSSNIMQFVVSNGLLATRTYSGGSWTAWRGVTLPTL